MVATIKVMVVDDQALVREGIASLLAIQPGIQVVGTAQDGTQALEAFFQLEPDVVLMDIRMPVMDGIEAAKKILSKKSEAIILMLTTLEDDEYIVKSLKAGAVGYLLKDMLAEDLAQAVRMAHRGSVPVITFHCWQSDPVDRLPAEARPGRCVYGANRSAYTTGA